MTRTRKVDISIPAAEPQVLLRGALTVPKAAKGLVVLAHGSGGSRNSNRDRLVAALLEEARFATLRVDLLDEHEARDHHNRFDIELLGERLTRAARRISEYPAVANLPIGYLGAGTGAAAALVAAARKPELVSAVVLQGAHAHQAVAWLRRVRAPTLHIVAELDDATRGYCESCALGSGWENLIVVSGAKHLFGEPAPFKQAMGHACEWFERHLDASKPTLPGKPTSGRFWSPFSSRWCG